MSGISGFNSGRSFGLDSGSLDLTNQGDGVTDNRMESDEDLLGGSDAEALATPPERGRSTVTVSRGGEDKETPAEKKERKARERAAKQGDASGGDTPAVADLAADKGSTKSTTQVEGCDPQDDCCVESAPLGTVKAWRPVSSTAGSDGFFIDVMAQGGHLGLVKANTPSVPSADGDVYTNDADGYGMGGTIRLGYAHLWGSGPVRAGVRGAVGVSGLGTFPNPIETYIPSAGDTQTDPGLFGFTNDQTIVNGEERTSSAFHYIAPQIVAGGQFEVGRVSIDVGGMFNPIIGIKAYTPYSYIDSNASSNPVVGSRQFRGGAGVGGVTGGVSVELVPGVSLRAEATGLWGKGDVGVKGSSSTGVGLEGWGVGLGVTIRPTKLGDKTQSYGEKDEDLDNDGLTTKQERQLGTNPLSTDSDRDGLSDKEEYDAGMDPRATDSDGDGILDGDDAKPMDPDADKDCLADGIENRLDLDSNDSDTDDDTIPDGDEHGSWRGKPYAEFAKAFPITTDDNGDEVDSLWETLGNGEATPDIDFDQDGLPNGDDLDDDGDGILTADEAADLAALGDNVPEGVSPTPYYNLESDGDKRLDHDESAAPGASNEYPENAANKKYLDPKSDQDGDGLLDEEEDTNGDGVFTPGVDASDLKNPDTDNDRVWDSVEAKFGSDPTEVDTDGDDLPDGEEYGDAGFLGKSIADVAKGLAPRNTDQDLKKADPVADNVPDEIPDVLDFDDDGDGIFTLSEQNDFKGLSEEAKTALPTQTPWLDLNSDGDAQSDHDESAPVRGVGNSKNTDYLKKAEEQVALQQAAEDQEVEQVGAAVSASRGTVETQPILFDRNSAEIKRESLPTLVALIGILKNRPEDASKIVILAHASEDGEAKHNLQLSQERAESVKKALIDLGLDASAIEASYGFGEGFNRPPLSGETEAVWQEKNRRVMFVITEGAAKNDAILDTVRQQIAALPAYEQNTQEKETYQTIK